MVDECVFCRIAKGEIPSTKINETDNFFAFLDVAPLVEGHTLIIPKKHFKTILDLPNSLAPELMDFIKKTSLKLMKEYNVEGFNLINNAFSSAGQIVDHVHFHILPRKKDDGYFLSLGKK